MVTVTAASVEPRTDIIAVRLSVRLKGVQQTVHVGTARTSTLTPTNWLQAGIKIENQGTTSDILRQFPVFYTLSSCTGRPSVDGFFHALLNLSASVSW